MPVKRKKSKVRKAVKAPARKSKARKAVKTPAKKPKRRVAVKSRIPNFSENSAEFNHKALWETYKNLQTQADKAWEKFRKDMRNNATRDVLIKDHNHLLLLLGECDYMTRECMRCAAQTKKTKYFSTNSS